MPKRHQQSPAKTSAGRNNPKKSTVITTGTPKKQKTYREEAARHENPEPQPQREKVPPSRDPSEGLTHIADSRSMEYAGERHTGSESNAHSARKKARLHEHHRDRNTPRPQPADPDFIDDLRPENLAGENHGLTDPAGYGETAYDVKDLYGTLADLTNDELRSIPIMPLGSRLEQGAKYIDLRHLEQGEFTATADMLADEDHYYVPKKLVDYVLWNRLNQVSNPARLDDEP